MSLHWCKSWFLIVQILTKPCRQATPLFTLQDNLFLGHNVAELIVPPAGWELSRGCFWEPAGCPARASRRCSRRTSRREWGWPAPIPHMHTEASTIRCDGSVMPTLSISDVLGVEPRARIYLQFVRAKIHRLGCETGCLLLNHIAFFQRSDTRLSLLRAAVYRNCIDQASYSGWCLVSAYEAHKIITYAVCARECSWWQYNQTVFSQCLQGEKVIRN
jgi:hypothetical protein